MPKIIFLLTILLFGAFGVWFFLHQRNALLITKPATHNAPQPFTKTPKIGILSLKTNAAHQALLDAAKQELSTLGYQAKYLQPEVTDNSAFVAAAQTLATEKVDLILANSTPAVKAAYHYETSIPIIFAEVGDPVGNGLAQSLDSSGRNATGVSSLSVDLTVKRLDLLQTAVPSAKYVYFIYQPDETASENSRSKAREQAQKLGLTLVEKPVTVSADLKKTAASLSAKEADAITLAASAMVWGGVDQFIEAQNREKIPFVGVEASMAEKGAVIAYGPDYAVMGKQVAHLIDQVIKGVKPQYIPIQRPEKVKLIVNQKAAQNIGLPLPPAVVSKADTVLP